MKTFLSFFLMAGEEALSNLKLNKSGLIISSLVLIAVNLIPVAGVYFFNWDPKMILVLYWAETGVIGILNIVKMIISGASKGFFELFLSFFLSLFFIVHFGGFMAGHGFFLFMILFANIFSKGSVSDAETATAIEKFITDLHVSTPMEFFNSEWFSLALLVISHLVSFIIFFIIKKGYKKTYPFDLMFAPYKRIVLMHILIVVGLYIITILKGDVSWYIYMLIAFKMVLDLRAHIKEKI